MKQKQKKKIVGKPASNC